MSQLRAALDNAFKVASNDSLRVNYVVANTIGSYFSINIGVFAFEKTQDSLIVEVRCRELCLSAVFFTSNLVLLAGLALAFAHRNRGTLHAC